MKVTTEATPKLAQTYPYLASGPDEIVVLIIGPATGIALVPPKTAMDHYPVGYYTTAWREEDFTPLPLGARIVLENAP